MCKENTSVFNYPEGHIPVAKHTYIKAKILFACLCVYVTMSISVT